MLLHSFLFKNVPIFFIPKYSFISLIDLFFSSQMLVLLISVNTSFEPHLMCFPEQLPIVNSTLWITSRNCISLTCHKNAMVQLLIFPHLQWFDKFTTLWHWWPFNYSIPIIKQLILFKCFKYLLGPISCIY